MADEEVVLRVRSEGGEETADKIGKVTAELRDAGTGSKEAATNFEALAAAETQLDENTDKAAAALKAFDAALDDIGQNIAIDQQKNAMLGFREGLEDDLAEMRKLGTEGAAAAGVLEEAIRRTTARIEALGDKGAQAGEQIAKGAQLGRTGVEELDAIVETAEAQIDRFNDKIQSGAATTARDVGRITTQYELLKEAIIASYGSVEAATPQAVASVERLEKELSNATSQANRLTNAVKDHNVQLQETGNRVNNVANSVQMLSGAFGAEGREIGNVVGNIGMLGAGYEGLKDSLVGVGGKLKDLAAAEIGASTSALGMTGAIGASAVAFGLAFEGMVKLEEAAGTNMEAFHELEASVKTAAKEGLNNFAAATKDSIEWLGAMSNAMADAAASVVVFDEDVRAIDGSTRSIERATRSADDLRLAFARLAAAGIGGKPAIEGYNAALAAGIPPSDELYKKVGRLVEIGEEHAQAMKGGAAGQQLWNDAVRIAPNLAGGLTQAVHLMAPAFKVAAQEAAFEAETTKKQQEAWKKASDEVKAHIEQLKALAKARKEASDKAIDAVKDELDASANNVTAINNQIAAIKALLPNAELHSVAIQKLAEKLESSIQNTDGLTFAQRRSMQAFVDSAKQAADYTKHEDAATKSVKDLTAALDEQKKHMASVDEQYAASSAATVSLSEQLDQAQTAFRMLDASASFEEVTAARKKIHDLEDAMKASQEQTNHLSAEHARLGTQVQNTKVAIDQVKKSTTDSTEEAGKSTTAVTNQSTAVITATTASKGHAIAMSNVATETLRVVDGTGKAVVAITNAVDPTNKLAGGFIRLHTAAKDTNESIAQQRTEILNAIQSLRDFDAQVDATIAKQRQLAEALKGTAGNPEQHDRR